MICEFFDWSLWNLPAIYCLKWKKIFPYNCQFLMTILESPHMFLNRTTLPQTYWPSRCWFSIAKVFLLESCGGLFLSNKVWFLVGPVGPFTVWVTLIKGAKIMFFNTYTIQSFFSLTFNFLKLQSCGAHCFFLEIFVRKFKRGNQPVLVQNWGKNVGINKCSLSKIFEKHT